MRSALPRTFQAVEEFSVEFPRRALPEWRNRQIGLEEPTMDASLLLPVAEEGQ
jgi:hypothetical protein